MPIISKFLVLVGVACLEWLLDKQSSLICHRAYLDCHLMVTNPLDYVEPLGKAGASGFTFHVEISKGGLWCCLLFPFHFYSFSLGYYSQSLVISFLSSYEEVSWFILQITGKNLSKELSLRAWGLVWHWSLVHPLKKFIPWYKFFHPSILSFWKRILKENNLN